MFVLTICNQQKCVCVCVCVCVQIVEKNARMKGSGEFNKAASTAYHHLDLEERERLFTGYL